jgi:hypothetical protein
MAMKNPFRADPTASLQSAQTALAKAEERIAQLTAERAAKLEAEGDSYAAEVGKIDVEINQLRASLAVHSARVLAMESRCRENVLAQLERERLAGIEIIRKRAAGRLEAARRLDTAHKQFIAAFAELMKADQDFVRDWPAGVSTLGLLPHYRLEGFELLSARRTPRPPSVGLARALAEYPAFNFVEAIEARNQQVIELIEATPIVDRDAA